jgi:hypothetical protein
VLDHARPHLDENDYRTRALLQFAGEEAKHIHLFKRFHAAFVRGFPVECQMIGPSQAIGAEVLRHDPLGVALLILMIEWMTQQHYLGSVRDDGDLDPLFKSLLKHHWMEEAQHAKLDTLIVHSLAEGRSEEQIAKAIDHFFEIGAFLDEGLKTQAGFKLRVGPISAPAWSTSASSTRSNQSRPSPRGGSTTPPRSSLESQPDQGGMKCSIR